MVGGCACGLIRSLRPGLPVAAPFTLPEEDWVEWQEGGGTPVVLKSAIRWNDTLYYAIPGDRRTVVLEEPLARVDQGLPWFEDLFFREYLQRVGTMRQGRVPVPGDRPWHPFLRHPGGPGPANRS